MDHISKESRTQVKMLCLEDFVSEDSPARQIDFVVDTMDTSYFKNAELKATGRPPYNPKDLLKLHLYGMDKGIVSSRKLRRECQLNMELRWLVGEMVPDYSTISDFRTENAKNLTRFFQAYSKYLAEAGYIDGKIVGIDGTKIRANNSKRNNFSVKKLDRHIEYIDNKIAEYMGELDKNDRIEALQERKTKYEGFKERIKKGEVTEVSTTDPDSRLMMHGDNGVSVSYNVQAAVDSKHKLIAGIAVVNSPADQGQLHKVAKSVKDNLGLEELTAVADKGYYDIEDLKNCHDYDIITVVAKPEERTPADGIEFKKTDFQYDDTNDCYRCPTGRILNFSYTDENGIRHYANGKACRRCPYKQHCTKGSRRVITRHKYIEHAEQNDRALAENYDLYRQRQMICEHPFGTVKRTMGIRQFLTRGLTNVAAEAALIFLCYNLKRMRVIHKKMAESDAKTALFACFHVIFHLFPRRFTLSSPNRRS